MKIDEVKYHFKQLDNSAVAAIRELFVSVFAKEPWNDDWSNENQLQLYIQDLTGQSNSLTFGLYEGMELIGISMGHVRHWYSLAQSIILMSYVSVLQSRETESVHCLLIGLRKLAKSLA